MYDYKKFVYPHRTEFYLKIFLRYNGIKLRFLQREKILVINDQETSFPNMLIRFNPDGYISVHRIPMDGNEIQIKYCGVLQLLKKINRFGLIPDPVFKRLKFPFKV